MNEYHTVSCRPVQDGVGSPASVVAAATFTAELKGREAIGLAAAKSERAVVAWSAAEPRRRPPA